MSKADYHIQKIREAIKRLPFSVATVDNIYELQLPVRVRNVLKWQGIETLSDILGMTDAEIYRMPNFGRKSINDLLHVITELGKSHPKLDLHDSLIKDEDLPDYGDDPVIKAILSHSPFNSSDWIGLYLESYPDYVEDFEKLNIKNDKIYIIERKKLPKEVINSADNFRFESVLPNMRRNNHQPILAVAPDWVLNSEIATAPCSVRLKNVMRNEDLIKFSDLLDVTQPDCLRMANFGRKTLLEIPEAIIACYNRGMPIDVEEFDSRQSLKECFLRALEELNEKQRYVLRKRSGIDQKVETLEEIAYQLDVTRERIRQIEMKATRTIKDSVFWVNILNKKLQVLFEKNNESIYIDRIATMDPWFEGFENNADLFVWIAKEFCKQKLFILQIDSREIISNVSKTHWSWMKSNLLRKLKKSLDLEYTRESIKVLTRYEIKEFGAFPSLAEAMHEDITSHCKFSHNGEKLVLTDIR